MSRIWDTIIIGGGPAGMMAAGTAAKQGRSVLLLEKNPSLGKKLLITGGGRCNLTNNKEVKELVAAYRGAPKALYSVFSQYDVQDTLKFFHDFGLQTKEENVGRMFPVSDSAESVWQVMVDYMKRHGVQIQFNCNVSRITKNTDEIFEIEVNSETFRAKSCVIATGGKSRPETGSDGAGFKWLAEFGHTIKDNNFALVPFRSKEKWVADVAGISFDDIGIEIMLDGQRKLKRSGKVLFTHQGLSGPGILNLSRDIGELLPEGTVTVSLDLFPKLDQGQMKQQVHDLLTSESNRLIKNTLGNIVTSRLVPIILNQSNISPNTPNHSITKQHRQDLRFTLKGLVITVDSLMGADKAVVSSGGVILDEVNMKTMESKIVSSLFIVGDVLDIDRPSGGYSLQLCWSTGFVAGMNA